MSGADRPHAAPRAGLRLQPLTRARVASLGEQGAVWEADLPRRLGELAQQWSLVLGRPLPGGSSSYVVRARTAAGREAVLKVSLPDPGLVAEAATLRRAAGRGYARLLAFDGERHALLLEALGPSLEQSGLAVEDQLRLLADTLGLAWRDPSAAAAAPVVDKATQLGALVERLWREQGRPCPARVVDQALRYAERLRAVPPGEQVVVHGDPHPANLLRAAPDRSGGGTGWCFVDPDGFVADRAYDLGVTLREWTAALRGPAARDQLRGWCRLVADRSGVDATQVWEWAYLERVSTGLSVGGFGASRMAREFLRTAELLC